MRRKATDNKVLPKAGLNIFDWTFVQGSIFILQLNFSTKTPPSAKPKTLSASVRRPQTNKKHSK